MSAPCCSGARIEVVSGPDSLGRYVYWVHRWTDYHPGHPAGDHRWAERSQIFHAPLPDAEVPS